MSSELLRNRNVVAWNDNTGVESSTRKGASKQFDHTCLVHCMWLKAAQMHMHLYVERVPTDDNIADLPSREAYDLLKSMGVVAVEAKLDRMFCCPEAWESLSAPMQVIGVGVLREACPLYTCC